MIAFGFVETAEEYIYIRQLLDESFEIKVIIYKNGKVNADVAAILRHKDSAKWYAAMLNLPLHKLGLDEEENTDVIDLRIDSTKIDTVVDGSVLLPEIYDWIDSSYQLAKNKK